jgi:two-component system sensor kinase FixL
LVSCHVLPLIGKKGTFDGRLCAITDVTERQQTEQAFRDLARELRARVKELNCLFSISHIVEQADRSLERILEETVELLPSSWEHSDVACARIAMGDLEFRTDNFTDTPWKQTADILVRGERVGSVDVAYLKEMPERDEGPFVAEERSLIAAVAERLGRVAERLQAERLVEEREQELRERLTHLTRVSVMGEMASSIAHEISQPLTAVATYAQACRRMVDAGITDSSLVRDALERIADEALRAGDIIHRLKDLVRKGETERTDCDINELVRNIENLASVDARLHEVKLRLELGSGLPAINADEVQIQQVILNLIRNGIDALDELESADGEVVVQTSCVGGAIQVSVTDNGCGLPEDAEDELFQPFFTTKQSGMGMGLSISRSIVDAHGGRLWFSRNPQRGTTFFFTIPASA